MNGLNYVIISYDCNFWGMASLEALMESLADSGSPSTVYVVHNQKTQAQIDHFLGYFRDAGSRSSEIVHVLAYEGLFIGVHNCFDFARQANRAVLASHSMVLNWLIKYRLPEGKYLFIDHDCIVHRDFVRNLGRFAGALEAKLFGFPDHEGAYTTLTAPMFYCDTALRGHLADICDTAWLSNVVGHDRHKLPGGGWPLGTDTEFERRIAKPNFDDTLYNVVRYLLSRRPELVNKFGLIRWRDLDHVQRGGTAAFNADQVEMLKRLLSNRLKPEFFASDHESSVLNQFVTRLAENGLAVNPGDV